MTQSPTEGSHKHHVVDVPTSLLIQIGKSAEMDGFLAKLIEDATTLRDDIKKVTKGHKFRFKLNVHFPNGAVQVCHTVDGHGHSIIAMECDGGNGGD